MGRAILSGILEFGKAIGIGEEEEAGVRRAVERTNKLTNER